MINDLQNYLNTPQITINLSYDQEKLKKDIKEFADSLRNLRKIFEKDFCIVVTDDKIKLMFDEE